MMSDGYSWDGMWVDMCAPNTPSASAPDHCRSIAWPIETNTVPTDSNSAANAAWNTGIRAELVALRAAFGSKILFCNQAISVDGVVNGDFFENYPEAGMVRVPVGEGRHGPVGGPVVLLQGLGLPCRRPEPRLHVGHPSWPSGGTPDWKRVRFGLATALLNAQCFGASDAAHAQAAGGLIWADEYDNAGAGKGYLGQPQGVPTKTASGAWRRDYDGGIVLANPTAALPSPWIWAATFRKIKGTQAPTVNDGSLVTAGDPAGPRRADPAAPAHDGIGPSHR